MKNTIDRREFLKVSAILGASLSLGASPLFALDSQPDSKVMPKRTLGKGDRAFEVCPCLWAYGTQLSSQQGFRRKRSGKYCRTMC